MRILRILECLAIATISIVAGADVAGAAGPAQLEPAWTYGLLGTVFGQQAFETVDIEGDGRHEIIVEGNEYLSLLGWPATSSEPHTLSLSPPLKSRVVAARAWTTDGEWRLAVALENDTVSIFELPTFKKLVDTTVEFDPIDLDVADLAGDSNPEVIVTGYNEGVVLDSGTLDAIVSIPFGASRIDSGNVDGDPALELVYATGVVVEIRASAPVIEWTAPISGNHVILTDLDGSQPLEIVIGDSNNAIVACSFGDSTPLWGFATDSIDFLTVADLTRDGVSEVITTDGGQREMVGLHPMLGLPIWENNYSDTLCRPGGSAERVLATNIDNDADEELIWSSTNGRLCIADPWSGDLLFYRWAESGPVHTAASGDLDGDGTIERVTAYEGGTVAVFSADEPTPRSVFYPGIAVSAMAIGDVDRDGFAELVVAGSSGYDGAIYEFDGLTLEFERGSVYGTDPISAIAIADIDGDFWPEVVFGEEKYGDSFRVGVVEGATTALEWTTAEIDSNGGGVEQLLIGEVDGDLGIELVVVETRSEGVSGGSVYIIDPDTQAVRSSVNGDFSGLDLCDLDNDGVDEILTGSMSGELVALDGVGSIDEIWRSSVVTEPIVGLRTYRDHFDRPITAVSSEGRLYGVDLASMKTIWTTQILGEDVGVFDGFKLLPALSGRAPSLLVGASYSLREIRPGDLVVFADDFSSGTTSSWSQTVP
jgi:hypothetical protein